MGRCASETKAGRVTRVEAELVAKRSHSAAAAALFKT
jgi:hypothetical protein